MQENDNVQALLGDDVPMPPRRVEGKHFLGKMLTGEVLSECHYVSCTFRNITIMSCSFRKLHFDQCVMDNVRIIESNVENVTLQNSKIIHLKLEKSQCIDLTSHAVVFSDVVFSRSLVESSAWIENEMTRISVVDCQVAFWSTQGSRFADVSMKGSIFNDANWVECQLYKCNWDGMVINRQVMSKCVLEQSLYRAVSGEAYVWFACRLVQVTFVKFSLPGASFHQSVFVSCHLAGLDMSGGVLSGAVMSLCDLRQAQLIFCQAEGACFSQCDFSQANLAQGLFSRATLDRCILDGCDITKADLRCADFSTTRLSTALGKTDIRIYGMKKHQDDEIGGREEPKLARVDEWNRRFQPGRTPLTPLLEEKHSS